MKPNLIALAPMEGVFDSQLRELYSEIGGYDLMTTEFIRVKDHLLPPKVFYKYAPELKTSGKTSSGTPVYIQLLGGDPEPILENAQQAVSLGALGIDINFGCPAKTVNRHDGGATLLKNPDRLFNILTLLRKNISKSIKVSAKVRLGFDSKDLHVEIAMAVEEAGADWITIHARTKIEAYKKPAHWEYIAFMKEHLSIPVFANGDINSVEDFNRCVEITGCENICVGRGAFARPDLGLLLKGQPGFEKRQIFKSLQGLSNIYQSQNLNSKVNPRLKQWMRFLGPNYPEVATYFENHKRDQNINLSHL